MFPDDFKSFKTNFKYQKYQGKHKIIKKDYTENKDFYSITAAHNGY